MAQCAARFAVPVAVVALVVGATFHRHLFAGWTFPWDFLGGYTASPAFVAQTAGRGHWTEWVPFVAGGFPLAVDLQSGLYFPLWWLVGTARVPLTLSTLTAIQVLHVVVGALGTVALARTRGVPRSWALVAGIAYTFFGGFYGQAEHANIFRGFAYAPWLLFALTPPSAGATWKRLLLVPLMAWLVAAGAYPGQLVAFGLIGSLYVAIELGRQRRASLRGRLAELLPAAAASAAVVAAVALPYAAALARGDLHRVYLPDAGARAANSWHPLDWFGLYLNNFAWTYEGTIPSWGLGVPVILGAACVAAGALRAQVALVVTGIAAGALAAIPAWTSAGELMTRIPLLFPSRFPASDYKAFAALALIVLAVEGWRQADARTAGQLVRLALAAGVLIAGTFLVPSTYAPATTVPWLVVATVLATAGLATVRPPPRGLAAAVLLLVVVDGTRMTLGYRHQSGESPWRLSPQEAQVARARDPWIRRMEQTLAREPRRRPRRRRPTAPVATYPTGRTPDAAGYVGHGYRLSDYNPTITRARWRAQHDPRSRRMALAPWMALTAPCGTAASCASPVVPPPGDRAWRLDPRITTTAYGLSSIAYRVDLDRPALMMENELAIPGWSADHGVKLVQSPAVFRTWAIPAGRYRYTASYRQPQRSRQLLCAALGLVAWVAAAIVVLRPRRRAQGPVL